MKLINLLASFMIAGGGAAQVVPLDAPQVRRPVAGVIEIDGADLARIWPAPVGVLEGGDVGGGWAAWAGPRGRIRFAVEPGTDYTVIASVGDTFPRVDTSHPMPVTREHRIEQAVRDLMDAQRRLQAESANFFDIERWQRVILAEQAVGVPVGVGD